MHKKIILILLVFAVTGSFSGCMTIRKKFIRKTKKEQESPVYVDFKEYSNKPTPEAYRDYLVFASGWLDELQRTLEKGISLKRERRAIDEALMNIEQIASFFNQEGQAKISPLYRELLETRSDIQRNANSNDVENSRLAKKTETLKIQLESQFSFSDAAQWMK